MTTTFFRDERKAQRLEQKENNKINSIKHSFKVSAAISTQKYEIARRVIICLSARERERKCGSQVM